MFNKVLFVRHRNRVARELYEPLRTDLNSLFPHAIPNFMKIVQQWKEEFKFGFSRCYNGSFESVDYELYYSVIRTFKPKFIIEVGAGHSTVLAIYAVKKNGIGRIIAIDPEPRLSLPKEVAWIKTKIQEVDTKIFRSLGPNDILFFDSSHTREEAEYHIHNILPFLSKGVIIHYHDILYPFQPITEEEKVILDFIARKRDTIKLITGAAYVRAYALSVLLSLVPSYRFNISMIPSSLWLLKSRNYEGNVNYARALF